MSAAVDGLFITTDAVGGVWSYSIALARGVAASGSRCVIAVLGPHAMPDQRAAVAEIDGCSLIETGLPLDWRLTGREALDAVIPVLIEHARAAECTAAHLHAPILAACSWPMPVVAVAHSCMATWWDAVHGGTPPASIAWHRAATAEGMAIADSIVAPSNSFAAALQRIYQPARRARVIYNGLPPVDRHAAVRDRAVLAAGRLWDMGKNIGMLDAAAAMLDVPVRVAGPSQVLDGACAPFAHVQETGTLTQERLHRLMASSAIFAAPSIYEPFGLAVLEAAQQATPLVLSDIPTFRELWSDAAVFVPPDRPTDWAAAITRLANDPRRLIELGQAALDRSGRYTQGGMVSETLELHRGTGRSTRRAA